LKFPFQALVRMPPLGDFELKLVTGLVPVTAEQARQIGVYFEVPDKRKNVVVAGVTMVIPADVTSPTRLAVAEYHAYRERVGPPPGTIGQPLFTEVE
jgi:hypothetical protein